MSLVIRERTKEYTPVPAGTHLAVCVLVADLGVQDDSKYKPRPKLYLRWELVDQTITWRDKEGVEHTGPMSIGRHYTLSLAPKSNLRADLENWRGRMFTEIEIREFDVTTVLGKPCMLGVVHSDKGDKIYANVAAVMGAPKGAAPKASAKLIAFDVDNWDDDTFALLPGWLQEKINGRLPPTTGITATTGPTPDPTPAAATNGVDFDDDIPF